MELAIVRLIREEVECRKRVEIAEKRLQAHGKTRSNFIVRQSIMVRQMHLMILGL